MNPNLIDPIFAHIVVISPVVLAIVLGLIARRLRYRDEVRECIKYAKQVNRRGYAKPLSQDKR